jgi:hypothetical protein
MIEDLVCQQRCEDGSSFCSTRGAKTSGLARERQKKLRLALVAERAREACLEEPTVQIPIDNIIDKPAPEPVDPLVTLLPQTLDLLVVGLDKAIQGGGSGISGTVQAGSTALCRQGDSPYLLQRERDTPACFFSR